MSKYGFVLDTPLPTVTVGAGDMDPIDFTLESNKLPINLTGKRVEMHYHATRGDRTWKSVATDGASPKLTIPDPPTAGIVRFSPSSPADLPITADQLIVYFTVGTGQRVPQDTNLWVDIIESAT